MLIFSRIIGLVLTAPFFSSESVDERAKLGFCFFLTIILFPLVGNTMNSIPQNMIAYMLRAVSEGMVGVVIGFCITVSFSTFQLAGQFFTVQMGFGASEVYDPLSEISLPIIGQYLYLLALLVFLSLNGPIYIIRELYESFMIIDINQFIKNATLESKYGIVRFFIDSFIIATKISLPIMGTLLLVTLSMGLLTKAAPQMNLFMIGFPISIITGFLLLLLILPEMVSFFGYFFDKILQDLSQLMRTLKYG